MKPAHALLAVAVAGIVALSLAQPRLMLAPGALIDGHRRIQDDCFACHELGRGVTAACCTRCHRVDRIGVTTVAGAPLARGTLRASFHRHLREQRCVTCHRDHRGLTGFRDGTRFDHALLAASARGACGECHRPPSDALHRDAGEACGSCHSTTAWKPADFDHDRYFALDADHRTPCATCHPSGGFARYTCYGCHEHSPARVAAEHAEEGIRRFDDCVRCHRSPSDHEGHGGRERGGEHEGGERD